MKDLLIFSGMKVYVNEHLGKPKMQMAPGEYISDEMRAKMNQWLLEFFGRTAEVLIMSDATFGGGGPAIFVNPEGKRRLIEAVLLKNAGA